MTNIDEMEKEVTLLISEIDDEEVLEEVLARYAPFKENLDSLINANTLDEYFEIFKNIDEEEGLVCFNLDEADDIKAYIEEDNINFDELKAQTMYATCEALKFIIYDSEEEEY